MNKNETDKNGKNGRTMLDPQMFDSHSHTPLCKHAIGHPNEYAAVAEEVGLKGFLVTCHNPMPSGFGSHVRMGEDEFETYLELVEGARDLWAGRVEIRLGIEADYFPGFETYLERQLESAPFHYVLGSVHPQLFEFKEAYWNDDAFAFQQTYFDMLAQAAETKLFDCISHPDLVKNQTKDAWDTAQIMDDIEDALDRIAATGVAMELNTSGKNKRLPEMNPFPAMLRKMHDRGIPVVVGSDAHDPRRVGDCFIDALNLLMDCGYREVSVFENRQRVELDLDTARESILQRQLAISER